MPDKFNGKWTIKNGRAVAQTMINFIKDTDSDVNVYPGVDFVFRMKILGENGGDDFYIDFPAKDVQDRFTIGPYTYGNKIYQGDVWRVDVFYDDDGIEILLAGVIKRYAAKNADSYPPITDSDTVSFTAIKTG